MMLCYNAWRNITPCIMVRILFLIFDFKLIKIISIFIFHVIEYFQNSTVSTLSFLCKYQILLFIKNKEISAECCYNICDHNTLFIHIHIDLIKLNLIIVISIYTNQEITLEIGHE